MGARPSAALRPAPPAPHRGLSFYACNPCAARRRGTTGGAGNVCVCSLCCARVKPSGQTSKHLCSRANSLRMAWPWWVRREQRPPVPHLRLGMWTQAERPTALGPSRSTAGVYYLQGFLHGPGRKSLVANLRVVYLSLQAAHAAVCGCPPHPHRVHILVLAALCGSAYPWPWLTSWVVREDPKGRPHCPPTPPPPPTCSYPLSPRRSGSDLVRSIVFGAMDGILSTFAHVAVRAWARAKHGRGWGGEWGWCVCGPWSRRGRTPAIVVVSSASRQSHENAPRASAMWFDTHLLRREVRGPLCGACAPAQSGACESPSQFNVFATLCTTP